VLTRTLALELAPLRVNVNDLAPRMVLTPFDQPAVDDPKRCSSPRDADYVTGATYVMDGGLMRNLGQGA